MKVFLQCSLWLGTRGLTHMSKLLIEKYLEDYRNGLKVKLRIQWIFCFRKYNG